MSITLFGSVNVDLTAYVDHLPRPGVTTHATGYVTGLGGKGANQAVAAQKLGTSPVRLVAAVGADPFGSQAKALLEHYGVATDHLITLTETETGIALIHVDSNSQNSITVVGGANMAWPDRGPSADLFAGTRVALFQLETPVAATAAAMDAARLAGATLILDPAPAPEEATAIDSLLRRVDILTPNESEAQALTGIAINDSDSALQAARALLDLGVGTAVVKLGARGLVYADKRLGEARLPAFAVDAVDTVAAGDCFNGALAVALAEGQTLPQALRFASAAGALATTRAGAAAAAPGRAETDRLLAD